MREMKLETLFWFCFCFKDHIYFNHSTEYREYYLMVLSLERKQETKLQENYFHVSVMCKWRKRGMCDVFVLVGCCVGASREGKAAEKVEQVRKE